MIIGYARVSSADQNLDRQIYDLEEFGCEKIYTEEQSGSNFQNRQVYHDMRSKLRFGDVLVVHDLSHFGRNKEEIRDEWKSLMENEIDLVVLSMPRLDTREYKDVKGARQLVSDLVHTLLSWMVNEDRERIRSAQREGIEAAKKQGKYKGRKKKYYANAAGRDKVIYDSIVDGLNNGTSVMDIHRKTGVSRSTIYSIRKTLTVKKELVL